MADTAMWHETVVEHVLRELKKLGIREIFGVPGDYAFPINDAICNDPELKWIGNCNELNAAYAADGYARIRGMAALCTTFGVGELSALCGVAGAYTEHLPIFHIVGMPMMKTIRERRIVHHTLGTGEFDLFTKMTKPAVCASSILSPENAVGEMSRLVHAALTHRRPVYLSIPADHAVAPVVRCGVPPAPEAPSSDPAALDAAVGAILEKLARAKSAVVLPGYLISRLGLGAEATALVEATGLPFATMFMDKACLDERHPLYIGMYCGHVMNPDISGFVENCDCVLGIGALWSDFNTGAYTARIDPSRMISVMHHHVKVAHATYDGVGMKDVLMALAKKVPAMKGTAHKVQGLGEPRGAPDGKITPEYLYPRWENFLKPGDIVIAETGTVSQGLGFAHLPRGAAFHNQTLWGSIGWATPAAFGAALAAPHRRTLLFTGEGAHQLTAQEVCQFARFGLKPTIFTLNNSGYLIERLLCQKPMIAYNDLAPWKYHLLPQALGCEGWFAARVTTHAELEVALAKAETCGAGAYIEVVMDAMACPPFSQKIHENIASLYGKK